MVRACREATGWRERERERDQGRAQEGDRTHLAELVDGGSVDLGEERTEGLLDEEAEGADHGNAAVRQLGLAAEHQLVRRQVLGEAERVEEAKGARDAW